jgi:hypothetical protein
LSLLEDCRTALVDGELVGSFPNWCGGVNAACGDIASVTLKRNLMFNAPGRENL